MSLIKVQISFQENPNSIESLRNEACVARVCRLGPSPGLNDLIRLGFVPREKERFFRSPKGFETGLEPVFHQVYVSLRNFDDVFTHSSKFLTLNTKGKFKLDTDKRLLFIRFINIGQ
jgi:hypothetical protein